MSEETKFECPNCHSDNIQSFEVAYRNGTPSIALTHLDLRRDITLLVDGENQLGLGLGTAKTTGTSVSQIAQEVAPPAKKGIVKKFLLIGIILMFLLSAILGSVSNTLGSIGALLGWVLSGAFVYKTAYLWNRDVYPQLLDQWHHSYICFRCGQHFTI